jgi:hypothetical protein
MKAHAAKPTRPRTLLSALRHARKALCCRLQAALRQPDPDFAQGFGTLVAEVEAIFRHEELIMGTLGYERQREQREENAVVLSALHRVLPQVEAGDAALGRTVMGALLEVLALHRLSVGLAPAVALQAPQRVRGSAARITQHVTLHNTLRAGTRPRAAR